MESEEFYFILFFRIEGPSDKIVILKTRLSNMYEKEGDIKAPSSPLKIDFINLGRNEHLRPLI